MPLFQDREAEELGDSPGRVVFIRLSGDLLARIQPQDVHHHDHEYHDHEYDDDEPGDEETVFSRPEEAGAPGAFTFNPAIPIPVELPSGTETFKSEDLSLEMILSGMLRLLSGTQEGPYESISAAGGPG
ncbi:MAG: hypothetical protein LBL56_02675, partial [Treponema sp.]|nr:hypothetical protein [Treponema sp.]